MNRFLVVLGIFALLVSLVFLFSRRFKSVKTESTDNVFGVRSEKEYPLLNFFSRFRKNSSNVRKTVPDKSRELKPINAYSSGNPFGVMLGPKNAGSASKLGVSYYRPTSLFVESWSGKCAECDTVLAQGIKLLLTVRNNGGQKNPTTPPSNLETYKKTLSAILDTYKTDVLVVENEENSVELFYTGSPQEYHAQLKSACEVAHGKGIKCTNGGLVSSLVALLVSNSYKESGQTAKAEEFLKRALGPKLAKQFGVKDVKEIFDNPKAKSQLERGKALLAGYKKSGADYVNFHWYIADTDALEEAMVYLSNYTGLPAMINEVGQQRNEDPNQVTAVMQKIKDLKLPYAVWFSIDVNAYGEAKGLVNADGALRPNGEAFKQFIDKNYK